MFVPSVFFSQLPSLSTNQNLRHFFRLHPKGKNRELEIIGFEQAAEQAGRQADGQTHTGTVQQLTKQMPISFSVKRKPVGTGPPPNTLKKNPSIIASETTNYDEQPWATAHLHQNIYRATNNTTPVMPSRSSDDAPIPVESEQLHNNEITVATEDTDAITPLHPSKVYIDPIAGHSNVTIPAHPPRKHTMSELFDLDCLAPDTQVRSPSGQLLSAAEFASRADRPLGIKERQEAIRRKVAEQREKGFGNEVTIVGDAMGKEQSERKEREKLLRQKGKKSKRERLKAKAPDCLAGIF